MSWATVLRGIDAVLQSDAGRLEKAVRTAELIRQAGGYRWVGLYEVTGQEIAVLGWSGPGAPAYPRFPVTQGLSGVAARRWSGAPPPSPACLHSGWFGGRRRDRRDG